MFRTRPLSGNRNWTGQDRLPIPADLRRSRWSFPLRDLKSLSWLQVTRDWAGVRCALDAAVIEGYSHIRLTLIILLDLASGS